jgi:hypothetical protein
VAWDIKFNRSCVHQTRFNLFKLEEHAAQYNGRWKQMVKEFKRSLSKAKPQLRSSQEKVQGWL